MSPTASLKLNIILLGKNIQYSYECKKEGNCEEYTRPQRAYSWEIMEGETLPLLKNKTKHNCRVMS
jgi:hypothetical protein